MATLDDALAALDDSTSAIADTQAKPSFEVSSPTAPKPTPSQRVGTLDDALDVLDRADRADQLNGAVALGAKQDRAKSTKILQLFGKTGLPQEFIERNQEFVEQESLKQNFDPDKLMKESPAFAAWLAESPDHVAAVKHEAPTLSYLERQWRRIKAAGETGPLMLELADLGNQAFDSTITPQDRARQAEIEKKLEALGKSADENEITGFFEGIPAAVVEQAPIYLRSLGGKVKAGAEGLVAGTMAGAVVGSAAGPGGTAAGAIGGGTVTGLVGWRYGAAIEAAKIERGHALLDYEKLKDEQGNPLDSTTIKGLSLMAGAINGALEGLTGVEALANKLPGVRSLTRKGIKDLLKTPTAQAAILGMAKNVGDTMLKEGATEVLQMYVTKTGGVLSQWAVDGGGPLDVLGKIFSAENAAQAMQEFKGGAQGSGGIATAMTTPGLIQDLQQVRQAKQNQRAFEAMGKAAESSQFAKDLPDHLKKIITEATKNGPVEQVYIPTDAFNTYFQGKGVDPREVAAAITGNVEAYDQAVQTGQDLAIPTGDYVAKLAGTEHNAFFAQELRTSLDAMNAREADEWQQMMTEQEQTRQEGVQAAPLTDPSAKIKQDIAGQLQGFASPDVIDQYAATMGERYLARAVRRGLGEDPFELFQRMNLHVTRQIPDILKKIGSQQTELDALLNRLRAQDAPKDADIFGQSLTEFLKAKGGIQDQGGELSARGVDQSRQAFKKKLVQPKGLTLDQAAELAVEAGYLEQRDMGALLDALDKDARGTPVYAIGKENARLLDVRTNMDSLKHFLASRNIDLNESSNEEIKALLGESVQQSLPTEGQTFAQGANIDPMATDRGPGSSENAQTPPEPGRKNIFYRSGSLNRPYIYGSSRKVAESYKKFRGKNIVSFRVNGRIFDARFPPVRSISLEDVARKFNISPTHPIWDEWVSDVPTIGNEETRDPEIYDAETFNSGFTANGVRTLLYIMRDRGYDAIKINDFIPVEIHAGRQQPKAHTTILVLPESIVPLNPSGPQPGGQTFAQGATITVDGVERSTTNSHGQPIAQTTEALENFWRWFGESQIVDAQLRPQVLYHQTSKENEQGIKATGFDISKVGARGTDEQMPDGIFLKPFPNDIGLTKSADETAQIPLYAKMLSPAYFQTRDDVSAYLSKADGYDEAAYKVKDIDRAIVKEYDDLTAGEERNADGRFEQSYFDKADKIFADGNERMREAAAKARKIAGDYLQSNGHDGVVINADAGSFGRKTSTLVVFDANQVKSATENRGTFDATKANILYQGDGSPKASITFGADAVSIKLLEQADLTSFIHETGHLYLNELIDDATTAGTNEQLRTDLDTILKWMGLDVTSASGKDAIKAAIQTKHHEQFARGWEAYTMEGKAPSQALREAFARFRQWMIQVYRSLTTSPLNVKLTKPVRDVMDRLIATDEAIDAAAAEADVLPAFTDAESAGMTPTQWNAYQDLVAKASMTARETLQAKLMKQAQREQQDWWKDKRMALLDTITKEVNEGPEYIALAVLKTGKMPDGSDIPHGIQPMKLDKKGPANVFGKDFLKRMPKGLTAKDGMHHDAVAQLFGFSNGQDFIMALVNARDKNQLIDAEADRRMKEEHGDMRFDGTIAEEAKSAVLNEQQEAVIAAELKAINQKRREVAPFLKAAATEANAAQRQGRELLSTMTPTLKSVRKTARKIMSHMALNNIKINDYRITARVASRKATAALAKQDWVNAGHFKQQELLNLALAREAGIVTERIEATREQAKAFFKADATLAKTRNVDLVNVGRAILAQYGLGTQTGKTAAEYLEPIQKYDQDLYSQWKPQVDALAPRPLPYTALTVDEFTKLADDLDALWLLARRTQQVKVDGQLLDRADVIDLLTAELDNKTTTERSRILGEQTKWEDAKLGLLSLTSALRRVESWVDVMDGGNINGIFRRFLWTPIQDAAVTFRTEKAKLLTSYLKIIQPIESTMTRELIPANELGQGFAFRGKSALVHAILHTGNESNKAKLLKGYGWDASQWDAFLSRAWQDGTLTKADYDYAQGVWDLLESIKPQAQQAHHEMYGYYFNEITAAPVQTPWGEYKGGYVPAIADSVKSVDQAIRQEKDLFDQSGNSFMFPTTGRGFTKARVEQYAAPLALNLATIPMHLDKVMRFVHLEPRVKDAARLVTNKQFRASLDGYNPTLAKDMLVPWLQRSAQQTVSSPGKNRHMDRFWRALRARTGAQIMVGNVVNTLQQFTGFSLSLVKVKAKYLRGGLVTYLKGPGAMANAIHAKSPFMAQRTTTQVMDIQRSIDEILLNPTKYEKAKDFAKAHGYFMQQGTQNIVDLITWAGAYDQQIADGAAEQEAVRAADAAVRQTQGSFDPEAISAFESGTPFVRAFTMFYSYFNMQANLLGSEFQKVAEEMGMKKGAGRAFYLYFVGFLIPAVIAETIVKSLGGFDADDEDGYLTESLSVFFGSQLRSALAFFPGVGPVALAGINAFNSKWYDDRISTSPIVSLIESASRAPHSLYQAMSEEGHSKRAVRDVLTLLGLVTGTPASALNRPVGYLADVYDGVATPENAVDVTRGLLSGKDVNRKK